MFRLCNVAYFLSRASVVDELLRHNTCNYYYSLIHLIVVNEFLTSVLTWMSDDFKVINKASKGYAFVSTGAVGAFLSSYKPDMKKRTKEDIYTIFLEDTQIQQNLNNRLELKK